MIFAVVIAGGLAGPSAWATMVAAPSASTTAGSSHPATGARAAKAVSGSAQRPSEASSSQAAPKSKAAPAGISDYSYIEIRHSDVGNSDYFGDSSKGNGAKFSFQFTDHAFVYGSYDRLGFDDFPGHLYRTGIGLGYQQTEGRVSAYVRIGYYRRALSASMGGAREYYFEPAYGMRAAFGNHFYLEGELYSDFHPDFGSRPWGLKFGVVGAFGPVTLHLVANHNRDVNSLQAALRFAF